MFNSETMVARLIAYRKQNDVDQESLSKAMGFRSRQILSSIEKFDRSLKPDELIKALDYLNVSFEEFVDPYSLIGEAVYSWRQTNSSFDTLDSVEIDTSRVVALYRDLYRKFSGKKQSVLLPKLPVTKSSSFSEVEKMAQLLASELELGDYPSLRIEKQLFDKFNIPTLYLDMPDSVSGAATRLNDMFVILVNKNEVIGRRNFDISHECFHCLTWDAIPPQHIERAYSKTKKPYEEKLADCFASSILMPADKIQSHFSTSMEEINENVINLAATKFGVSSDALKWRLKGLNILSKNRLENLDSNLLRNNGNLEKVEAPRLYNEQFVSYLYKAIDTGFLSVRRICSTLKLSFNELRGLFESYGIDAPFDL